MHDTNREVPRFSTEASEGNQIASWGPHWCGVPTGAEADPPGPSTARRHHVELLVSSPIRVEDDLTPIGAVTRADVDRAGIGKASRCMAGEIDADDVGACVGGNRHHHAVAVRGEPGCESHAREIPQHPLLPRAEIEQVDARPIVRVAHEGDFIPLRMKARCQHHPGAVGEIAVVLAILVHDCQAFGLAPAGAAGSYINDAGIEVAFLTQQAFIDDVGYDVGDAAPVRLGCRIGSPLELRLWQHVPQPKFQTYLAAALRLCPSRHQRLCTDSLPVLEVWHIALPAGGLNVCLLCNWSEQTG